MGNKQLAFWAAALAEKEAVIARLREACIDMLADLDSFEGPEKWVDGDYPHYCPAGRMVDMKHIARIRSLLPPDEKKGEP